jgi:hypothetical protein
MPDRRPGIDYPTCAVLRGDTLYCPKFGWTFVVDNWPFRCACPKDPEKELAQITAARKAAEKERRATRPAPAPRVKGPGDYLHQMIRRWTREEIRQGCGCDSWIRKMNDWGPAGSREHIDEIVDHILKQARQRGWKIAAWPGAATAAKLAVTRACRMAERDQSKPFTQKDRGEDAAAY